MISCHLDTDSDKMAEILSTLTEEISWVLSQSTHGSSQRQNGDYWNLLYPLPMVIVMFLLRYFLFRFCYAPWGLYLGVEATRPKQAPPNPVLEHAYAKWTQIPRSEIVGLCKQTDMTERQIQRWMRLRSIQDRPSTLTKFCECCWRCTYYTTLFLYGLAVLWNKPWFWDIKQCWTDYLNQDITNDIWLYYMVSLAFYWSLFFGQFFVDVKRKDFWQMFIHHNATILLISFSWMVGAARIGTLVLLVHDLGDIFLEASKLSKYAHRHVACVAFFCVFVVVWIATRLGIFPLWIIKHTLYDVMKLAQDFGGYYTFNGLLVTLQMLHCFWTYLIVKTLVITVRRGKVENDLRSSSDEASP